MNKKRHNKISHADERELLKHPQAFENGRVWQAINKYETDESISMMQILFKKKPGKPYFRIWISSALLLSCLLLILTGQLAASDLLLKERRKRAIKKMKKKNIPKVKTRIPILAYV